MIRGQPHDSIMCGHDDEKLTDCRYEGCFFFLFPRKIDKKKVDVVHECPQSDNMLQCFMIF